MDKCYDDRLLDALHLRMISFDAGDPKRIQHFTKVFSYAGLIGAMEGMEEKELFTLKAAALVHDIGIHVAEKKYGYQNGKLQEAEGPGAARSLLEELGFAEDVTERVCYLVGHHHTYQNIDGLDYQILVEADFIVNIFEDGDTSLNHADQGMKETTRSVLDKIFKTTTGKNIMQEMFLKNS